MSDLRVNREAVGGPVDPPSGARVTLRLFASARQAAATGRAETTGRTVGEVLAWAAGTYGEAFAAVLAVSRVWCNGEPTDDAHVLTAGDEIAVLPPVSGGCR